MRKNTKKGNPTASIEPNEPNLHQEEITMPARASRSKRLKTTSVIEAKRRRLLSISDITGTSQSKKNPRDMATTIKLVNCRVCKNDDKEEILLNCKGHDNGNCSIKVHLSCLKATIENFGDNEEQSWQCNNCQSCVVCKKVAAQNTDLLKCYNCFKCYHAECYEARIKIVKNNRFCCESCEKAARDAIKSKAPKRTVRKKTVAPDATIRPVPPGNDRTVVRRKTVAYKNAVQSKTIVGKIVGRRSTIESILPPPIITNNDTGSAEAENRLCFNASDVRALPVTHPPSMQVLPRPRRSMSNLVKNSGQNPKNDSNEYRDNTADVNNIPDVSNWSTVEVHEYFEKLFPLHAHVFKYEEIDGTALYQLTREVLVDKFQIKVGPALNIYAHLLKIQRKMH